MKELIEIENDLSLPLNEKNVEWNLYLYKKRYKKKILDTYDMYKINSIKLDTVYSDIHNNILKKYLNKYEITNYTADMPKNQIGYIDFKKNSILNSSLELLKDGIDNYTLFDSKNLDSHGYILECKIDNSTYMKLICTSNPIKIYTHKYSLLINNNFEELEKPILTINVTCDCILFEDYSLFITGKAENIFDLERHYKALASKCLLTLKNKKLLENFDTFSSYASIWPKASKFENFDTTRINAFSDLSNSKKEEILKLFSISINKEGNIIANNPEEFEKVLNFVCGNLLLDFNNDGYEVNHPRKINL